MVPFMEIVLWNWLNTQNNMKEITDWSDLQILAYYEYKDDDSQVTAFVEWLQKNYPDGITFAPKAVVEEREFPVRFWMIQQNCGWGNYCDVTGANHYMLNEFSVDDDEIFMTKESHARQLGLIK